VALNRSIAVAGQIGMCSIQTHGGVSTHHSFSLDTIFSSLLPTLHTPVLRLSCTTMFTIYRKQ